MSLYERIVLRETVNPQSPDPDERVPARNSETMERLKQHAGKISELHRLSRSGAPGSKMYASLRNQAINDLFVRQGRVK